jgi:transcriptional regulator with XRE-family HTH domain
MTHIDLTNPPQTPSMLGLALGILLTSHGLSGQELSIAAGVSPSTISESIRGSGLTRERLDEFARLLGLGPLDVERSVLAARLVLPPRSAVWSPVDPTPEERRIDEKAAALAAGEMADRVLDVLLREHRSANRERGLEEGRRLAKELLIRGRSPDEAHWGLVVALCEASETAAPKNPARALEVAKLAVEMAREVALEVPGSEPFRLCLQGWATAFVANAERVLGQDLPGASRRWIEVWTLWRSGEDTAGLLSEGYLLDMEASLRRDQGCIDLALKLHEEALSRARPEERGIVLMNQAVTRKEGNDPEGALKSLEKAAGLIDGERQPRHRWVLRFNQATSLCLLGRAGEALLLVAEIRRLAEQLRNKIDLTRTLWLEAKCLAGLERQEEALVRLEQVRSALEANPFDYALASLDVATLYREEGRFAEIKELAGSILEIFKAQEVHREALAAAILFHEAAEEERVSMELVRRLQEFLSKARTNPRLRFQA